MGRLDAEDKAFLDLFRKDNQPKKASFRQRYDEMQAKFNMEHGTEQINQDQKAANTLGETMKRLNIIDMTGAKTQV